MLAGDLIHGTAAGAYQHHVEQQEAVCMTHDRVEGARTFGVHNPRTGTALAHSRSARSHVLFLLTSEPAAGWISVSAGIAAKEVPVSERGLA